MAPYLFFYNVCCVFRMATTTSLPPGVCFGDSSAADGASIPLLPWEHGDLGVVTRSERTSSALSDFRFSELDNFDIVN